MSLKNNTKPKVVIICGPTATGKTSTAIELAGIVGGEIIGADSMQVYRYMDIGTTKPTAYEQACVPHHMIDIVDPDEHFDARKYAEMGLLPGGLQRNHDFRRNMVAIGKDVPDYLADILFDAQTSGGLLVSVAEEKAGNLLKNMHQAGIKEAAIIGEVVAEPKGKIIVR